VKTKGLVIYRGPSMLDGAPIVAIATGLGKGSRNTKTGALAQVWILREDVSPVAAIQSGADASICGDCPHRGTVSEGKNTGRSCYVTVVQAPRSVWASYHRGIYAAAADLVEAFDGVAVRLGAYGDPAAVPLHVWQQVTERATFFTGYTHQWRRFPELAAWCMASCDTLADRLQARMLGFRTFRVRADTDPIADREIACPASAEMGKRTSCFDCKLCGGTRVKAKDITIIAHGTPAVHFTRNLAA
jgi:hypothetical protein